MITSNKILKISDFGMSRNGSYVNRKPKKMPLRWMAIESIQEKTWDNKSDVWSFGVVLWEIGTLGKINLTYSVAVSSIFFLMSRCVPVRTHPRLQRTARTEEGEASGEAENLHGRTLHPHVEVLVGERGRQADFQRSRRAVGRDEAESVHRL